MAVGAIGFFIFEIDTQRCQNCCGFGFLWVERKTIIDVKCNLGVPSNQKIQFKTTFFCVVQASFFYQMSAMPI